MKYKIFISSNQSEFEVERREIKNFIENDPLYSNYFKVFIFEDVPASGISPHEIYIEELRKSDIFIGLIVRNYGNIKNMRLSATEEEFDEFRKGKNRTNAYMFILEDVFNIENIDKKTKKFIKKAEKCTYSKILTAT
ncbi:MAG: DUF4062 domain-containing protein [Methanobrevibacter sp.]|nr:DUF4062 domain-containing protein [Methanobrevibacter sp.]